jgi:acyl-coenzyme A thioesterase PaaI-like protein
LQGYARHVGPIWSDADGALALRIEPRHTNITGRVHGGMAMGLGSMAMGQAAERAARTVRPGAKAAQLSFHTELMDSAQAGDWVFTDFHVRNDDHGEPVGGLQVKPACLDSGGGNEIDAGMVLMMADLFLGRRARTFSGSVCVTVGMGISRLARVRLGDALEVETCTEGQHGKTLVVTGRFRVNGLPVFSATSLWKMVEKK